MYGVFDPARNAYIVKSVSLLSAVTVVRKNPGTKVVQFGNLAIRTDPARCHRLPLRQPKF